MVGSILRRGMNRLPLFPETTEIKDNNLTIDGQVVSQLADEYGTPLYLYDCKTMNHAVSTYKNALAYHYPYTASITYAGKAYLSTAIAQWTQRHNLWLDCTSESEIAIGRAGNVPHNRLLVHGVNKSDTDLKTAIQCAGTVVVDNLSELHRIVVHFPISKSQFPDIWLRLQPGLAVSTHTYTQTGQHESKFGMNGEELMEAALFCRENNLPLKGLHFHQGSQFRDPTPLKPAIELAMECARQIGFLRDWHFSPGGGWGVAYHENELPHPDLEKYVHVIAKKVVETCQKFGMDLPHLHIEPGRSIVARAGVAIYRVNTVKRQGKRTWLLVDGGLADNPRFALYGVRYSALPVASQDRERNEEVNIAGPYCESGDVLIENLPMPKIEEGELIAVPMSGAYQLSMSSNYNGARRPAVIWLENGQVKLIQKRETLKDLLQRDFYL